MDKDVSAGKITAAQEQALINELNTLKSQLSVSNLKSMTPAQRRQVFQTMRSNLQTWAQSQGINLSTLNLKMGFGGLRDGLGK